MAVIYRPELFTIEDVEKYFEISKGNCFRIYAGTNPKHDDWSRGEYCEGDKQIAATRLQDCLIALKQNTENTNPYTLQVFNLDKKGQAIDKNCIVFQLNNTQKYSPFPAVSGTDPALLALMKQSIESQNLILSKIAAMEEDDEEEEEEPAGFLGEIMKDEQMKSILIQGLSALAGSFIGNQKPPTYGGGIAGTVDQESVSLLQQLFNKGVDNNVLAKLNQMSEAKLKSLLLML